MVEKAEIEDNDFNLNLPRYIDTFEPETLIPLTQAIEGDELAMSALLKKNEKLYEMFGKIELSTPAAEGDDA